MPLVVGRGRKSGLQTSVAPLLDSKGFGTENAARRCPGKPEEREFGMSAGVEYATARPAVAERTRLKRGRTWMLIVGDMIALTTAYAISYLVSDQLGTLPPVSAPSSFLI